MPTLVMRSEHLESIGAHAARIYPHECCGFLLGRELWKAESVLAAANDRGEEERHNRFVITPEASRRAEREARRAGLEVIGHYHSHPDAPARPSTGFAESDLASATWPGYAFVIASVLRGEPAEVTCWNLAEDRGRFEPVPIEIAHPAAGHTARVASE